MAIKIFNKKAVPVGGAEEGTSSGTNAPKASVHQLYSVVTTPVESATAAEPAIAQFKKQPWTYKPGSSSYGVPLKHGTREHALMALNWLDAHIGQEDIPRLYEASRQADILMGDVVSWRMTCGLSETEAIAEILERPDADNADPEALFRWADELGWPDPVRLAEQEQLAKAAKVAQKAGWVDPGKNEQSASLSNVQNAATSFKYERDGTKRNRIVPSVTNILHALLEQPFRVRFDAFRDQVVLERVSDGHRQKLRDPDYTKIQEALEGIEFATPPKERIRDCINLLAADNTFDSGTEWLKGLPDHDGVPRVETFLTDHYQVADSPYARAVSRYIWTALAGRALVPGIKCDMVVVFVSKQGTKKTTSIEALAPFEDWFGEVSLTDKDTDASRKMRGKLVCEVAELRGLQTRDAESVKAFITRRFEEWTPKYIEHATTYPRHFVMFGTTNTAELLSDETGNRRWLPVTIGEGNVPGIVKHRDQLWAEGRALFEANGIAWKDAQKLVEAEHEGYTISDSWEQAVEAWLNAPHHFGVSGYKEKSSWTNGDGPFALVDVATGALKFEVKDIKRPVEIRLAKILRGRGYEKRQTWVADEKKNRMLWVKTS